jgi:hypothetical protein
MVLRAIGPFKTVGIWLARQLGLAADASALPASCLRGLRKADWVKDGVVETAAFIPGDKHEPRTDGGSEVSINWQDSEDVTTRALGDHRNAAYGVARLARVAIEDASGRCAIKEPISYERQKIAGNPHHGNIVYRADVPPHVRKMLAASLALDSRLVPRSRN